MKITAARKDEILKQRSDYDSKVKWLEDYQEDQEAKYRMADREAAKVIEKRLMDDINMYAGPISLNLEVTARSDSNWSNRNAKDKYFRFWHIYVRANENNKFADNVALSWNWEVSLDSEGNIRKESGSWSGLKAVTPEQMNDLEESVRILKVLNGMNWDEIVNGPMVDRSEYIDPETNSQLYKLRQERPKFEDDLLLADLDELIGGNKAVRLKKDEYYRGTVYILPTGYTDKFVKGYIFPAYKVTQYGMTADQIRQSEEERRTKKENLVSNNGEYDVYQLN